MTEHQVLQRLERLVATGADRGEDLQHLVGVGQPATRGEAVGLRADEQQVQQRFLRRNRASKRCRHGDGFLEHFLLRLFGEGVQHQRVPHEKLVLKLLNDRLARFGPAPPVDVAHGVTGPVVAQRDKFIAAAHAGGQGDAPFLILQCARQGQRRQRVALGQDQHRLRHRRARVTPAKRSTPRRSGVSWRLTSVS